MHDIFIFEVFCGERGKKYKSVVFNLTLGRISMFSILLFWCVRLRSMKWVSKRFLWLPCEFHDWNIPHSELTLAFGPMTHKFPVQCTTKCTVWAPRNREIASVLVSQHSDPVLTSVNFQKRTSHSGNKTVKKHPPPLTNSPAPPKPRERRVLERSSCLGTHHAKQLVKFH